MTMSCASNVFLSHARVLVFTDCYGISSLTDLSFSRLRKALVDIEVDGDTVEEIVDILQYFYDELAPSRLRQLMVLYAVCRTETRWRGTELRV